MKKGVKFFHFIIINALLIIFLVLNISANLEINSSNYSGYFTQGTSSGNITDENYSGNSASFYQQAIGYLSDSLYSGIHSFSFQIASALGFAPSLSLANPSNGTYITGTNIPLNFTASNKDYVWYNLDQVTNITITGNTTFNTTAGGHTVYLYANNSNGISLQVISFIIDSSKFLVHYDNYSGSTRGSSTDFNKSSYEELQNLSHVILENTDFGKIFFNVPLNLTNDMIAADNEVDLDLNTNISQNHIEINSTMLPNLNKSATLYLYNLTFSNPRILKDGSVCSSSICTKQNYSGGTLIFNVTGFSVYSAEETPVETPSTPPSGGGGISTTTNLLISPDTINLMLKQGETQEKTITIKNTGANSMTVSVGEDKLTDFIKIDNPSFSLGPGESKTVSIDFLAKENAVPNLYLGKIIITAGGIRKEVLVAVNVESKQSLFDVTLTIPTGYENVNPGKDLIANIIIYNLGEVGKVDANIDYIIENENGSVIATSSDTVAVETQASFAKTINIPEDTPDGKYLLYVHIAYNGKVAGSSTFFNVTTSFVSQRDKVYILIIAFLLLILTIVIRYLIEAKSKRPEEIIKKIGLGDIVKRF